MNVSLGIGAWRWTERWKVGPHSPSSSSTHTLRDAATNTLSSTSSPSFSSTANASPSSPSSSFSSSSSSSPSPSSSSFSHPHRTSSDGSFLRLTSEHTHAFRHPLQQDYATRYLEGQPLEKPVAAHVLSHAAAGATANEYERRGMVRPTGPRKVLPNLREEEKKPLRPEQYSGVLWGRINPSFCVMPYETEAQANYNREHSIQSKYFSVSDGQFKNKFRSGKSLEESLYGPR